MTGHQKHRSLEDVVSRRAAARLRRFRRDAERVLNGRVTNVILFGSRARGDARRDSDYDVVVLVERLTDQRLETHALVDAAYPHLLAGYAINPIAVPSDFLKQGANGSLPVAVGRDGVVVD